MRIVFFGTPEFSVPSLRALHEDAEFDVVAVVTAADKPAGRGRKIRESEVKQFATQAGIPVLQPEKLKDPQFLKQLFSLEAELFVVIAFRMLPEVVWNHPPLGTINLHASYLPDYRGAAPINWVIINGETHTGLSTFRLQHEIDTGNLLLRKRIPLAPNETAGSLHDRLSLAGAPLILETLRGIQSRELKETIQDEREFVHMAPKLNREVAHIHWNRNAKSIQQLIRGLSPFPAAFCKLGGRILKIYQAEIGSSCKGAHPGSIQSDQKNYFQVATNDFWLKLTEIQAEGKNKMPVNAWLAGLREVPEQMDS